MFLALSVACGAVYPELATPLRTVPPAAQNALKPPPDLIYLRFHGAQIPKRTRDGREWDAIGGALPDPFAILYADGKELFRTPIQSNTLTPTWPDAAKANYRVSPRAPIRIELWDKNSVQDHPVCAEDLRHLEDEFLGDIREIQCEGGTKVWLRMEAAHARYGMGFWYELRDRQIGITRVLRESPAYRAGLRVGQRVLSIQGKEVTTLAEGEAQSLVNSNLGMGIQLVILDSENHIRSIDVREGPIYPVFGENIAIE